MRTDLETLIDFEDQLRKEVVARFPLLDPDWAVNRYMSKIHENGRKTAKIVVLMMPEILRVAKQRENKIAATKTN